MRPVIFGIGAAAFAVFSAQSAEKVVRETFAAKGAAPVRLGVFGRVTSECKNETVTMRVVQSAVKGKLIPKKVVLKAGMYKACPGLQPVAVAFFYVANQDSSGSDRVVIEISTPQGQSESHEYSIELTQ